MHLTGFISAGLLALTTAFAAPARRLSAREDLCSLKSPPQLCQPNSSYTVQELAERAYKFYRAFVLDGDPRTMFSLIDNVYTVRHPSKVLTEEMHTASREFA